MGMNQDQRYEQYLREKGIGGYTRRALSRGTSADSQADATPTRQDLAEADSFATAMLRASLKGALEAFKGEVRK